MAFYLTFPDNCRFKEKWLSMMYSTNVWFVSWLIKVWLPIKNIFLNHLILWLYQEDGRFNNFRKPFTHTNHRIYRVAKQDWYTPKNPYNLPNINHIQMKFAVETYLKLCLKIMFNEDLKNPSRWLSIAWNVILLEFS